MDMTHRVMKLLVNSECSRTSRQKMETNAEGLFTSMPERTVIVTQQ